MKTILVTLMTSMALSVPAWANFSVPQLDPTITDALFRSLASTVAFRPLEPASSASLFGFSLGVTGISSSANQSSALVSTGNNNLVTGDISAAVQVPFGFAVEAGYLPSIGFSGANIGRFGIDLKWTFTDVFFSLPFNAALRGYYTNATLTFSEALNNGSVNGTYTTNMSGANISFSKKIVIIEPYVSYGFLQQNSTLSGSGSASLFDGNFAAGTTSISNSGTTGWFQIGAQVKILILTVALEYDNMFYADSYAGRVAFSF